MKPEELHVVLNGYASPKDLCRFAADILRDVEQGGAAGRTTPGAAVLDAIELCTHAMQEALRLRHWG